MKDFSVIMAGFGGQGILSAGKFVAHAAMLEGREVSWLPSYGPEMRGGTANCCVVVSDEPIGSPVVNDADVLIALNGPSLEKFADQVKPGGLIIVDSTLVHAVPARRDIRFIPIPASAMASDAGNMTFAAIILLGCLSSDTKSFSRDSFENALKETLPVRHHHFIPQEMTVFDQGAGFAGEA
ncbi:MAG: 2-oxoacid:acceptor oxidoreductase family protein [Clostridiaceae bacterium]|nr:2-oxoacid:acceptor oxidoreductase family protein [Clostridiaceae bacterium]